MAVKVKQIDGTEKTWRVTLDDFKAGRYTAAFPHEIPDDALYVADNVVFNFDALVSKRPGNEYYGFGGGGNGQTGSGVASLSGFRFYPGPVGSATPQLMVQSGGKIYKGNDTTGAFTAIAASAGMSASQPAAYAQMRDPDMTTGNAVAAFVCDGGRIPQVYDGTNWTAVQTGTYAASGAIPGGNYLPNGVNTGTPIKPKFCINWREHMVYAGDPDDPTALWISDANRPERFNGFSLTDSGGVVYAPYYPGGPDGALGRITGLAIEGPFLVILFAGGVVSAINTGTYSVTQYQFATISSTIGMPSEKSYQSFNGYGIFFGGDQFYACNGEAVTPLPRRIPDIYSNTASSVFPSDMKGKNTVVAARRGTQYWASYDNVGSGKQTVVVVFETSANNGYQFGAQTGGAWSRWPVGMPVAWALECRQSPDSFQMFWGSAAGDLVAQHDVGTYDDFGAVITCEVRAKALFLDQPINPKKILALYLVGAFQTMGAAYTDSLTGYCVLDLSQSVAPATPLTISPSGTPYGAAQFGTFEYGSGSQIIQQTAKAYPQQEAIGNAVQPGVIESSKNPFNLIAFVLDLIIDNPIP